MLKHQEKTSGIILRAIIRNLTNNYHFLTQNWYISDAFSPSIHFLTILSKSYHFLWYVTSQTSDISLIQISLTISSNFLPSIVYSYHDILSYRNILSYHNQISDVKQLEIHLSKYF